MKSRKLPDGSTDLSEALDIALLRDFDNIIKKAVKETISNHVGEKLEESYVAQPKQYRQVSELVSQKTKDAHRKLYERYIETLNEISAELDTADRSEENFSHSMLRSCKIDESKNANAVWLHELYFANCYDPNSEVYMDSIAYLKLQRDFGTFEDWQKDFVATAQAAGQGWVVCGYNMFLKRYVNTIVSDHSNDVMLGLYPVIVVDMHEHAYFRDYLTDKQSYLIAQMREFNWSVIDERFKKSESIAGVVK